MAARFNRQYSELKVVGSRPKLVREISTLSPPECTEALGSYDYYSSASWQQTLVLKQWKK